MTIELAAVALAHAGRTVFRNADLLIRDPGIVCVLGQRGSGRTSLIGLLGGTLRPDAGIVRPVASPGPAFGRVPYFNRRESVRNGIRFVARIHGMDASDLIAFADDVLELGHRLDHRLAELPAPLRTGLNFTLSYLLPRSALLIDDSVAPASLPQLGDRFLLLLRRAAERMPVVVATRSPILAKQCGGRAVLIADHALVEQPSTAEAIRAFRRLAERDDG